MKKSTVLLAGLCALAIAAQPGRLKASSMIQGVANPGWAPPYTPMSASQAADIQSVINGAHALGIGTEIELPSQLRSNLNRFNPQIELDRRILGVMKLPRGFSERFQEANLRYSLGDDNPNRPLAVKALVQEILDAYQKAVPFAQRDVRLWSKYLISDVREGAVGAGELANAAEKLKLFRLYGAQAERDVERVENLARVAKSEATMDLAREIAARFLKERQNE